MKKIVRLLSLLLVVVMGLSGMAGAAYEEELMPYTNAYIESVVAVASKSGDTMTVTFTVYGTGIMTYIGASSVKIYTSGDTLVKTFWSSENSSMLGRNRSTHTSTVSYDGTDGTSYYAVVKFYATDSTTGSGSETYTTNTITL